MKNGDFPSQTVSSPGRVFPSHSGAAIEKIAPSEGEHSLRHPFRLGLGGKSGLPLAAEVWRHRPLGDVADVENPP